MKKFKVIIAGGRDFQGPELFFLMRKSLDRILGDKMRKQDVQIVSGMAKGADSLALDYAHKSFLSVKEFPADWQKHGRAAGYRRNEDMAEYADAVVCFWDGKSSGTKHMIDTALKLRMPLRIIHYSTDKTFLRELKLKQLHGSVNYESLDMANAAGCSEMY